MCRYRIKSFGYDFIIEKNTLKVNLAIPVRFQSSIEELYENENKVISQTNGI
jgi:hypothetical protein